MHFGGGPRETAVLSAVLAMSNALSGIVYAAVAHRIAPGPIGQAGILLALLIVGSLGLGFSTS